MSAFVERRQKIHEFLSEYQALIDSHLVDFVTEDLWAKSLPCTLREEFETLGVETSICHLNDDQSHSTELRKFCQSIELLSLQSCNSVYQLADIPELLSSWGIQNTDSIPAVWPNKLEFMNAKKSYEVEILARVVSSLANFCKSSIIDAGAGKGYLSIYISEKYGIPVLAIDSSHTNHKSAVRRQGIMKKKFSSDSHVVCHVKEHIDESTDFLKLSETHLPKGSCTDNLTITGLHTCGSLANTTIKAFVQTDCIKSLCVVSCCYHLAEASLNEKFNISKNAKMLAQQSVERACLKNYTLSSSLHYRAVLQVLLHSLGMGDVRLGRGGPLDTFASYATWALRKIGLQLEQIPGRDFLNELYESHESFKLKMELFQAIRVRIGCVIESAILLDRMIYLETSKACSKLALVKLFDPVISPRCYGIIAMK